MKDEFFSNYSVKIQSVLGGRQWKDVLELAKAIEAIWLKGQRLYLCGNGGSAANAIHLANDFLYGVGGGTQAGIRVEALSANPAVLTCIANDVSYKDIFGIQLEVKGQAGDVLVVLSGSGNSPNVVRALEVANKRGMTTAAVLGYSGGLCLGLADISVHFEVDDMQIAEDLQLVVGHMCMQWLKNRHVDS